MAVNFFQHANEDVEKMLLGNKCDMEDRRAISRERGEDIARQHGIRFLETSAKANINVERAFYELSEAILDKGPNKDKVFTELRFLFYSERFPQHHDKNKLWLVGKF